jgi:uncharacterized protein involved in exopolysaccharide biosynthesis
MAQALDEFLATGVLDGQPSADAAAQRDQLFASQLDYDAAFVDTFLERIVKLEASATEAERAVNEKRQTLSAQSANTLSASRRAMGCYLLTSCHSACIFSSDSWV